MTKKKLKSTQTLIKMWLIFGIGFSSIMSVFDYFMEEQFSWIKLFFRFFVIGGLIVFINRYEKSEN